MTLAPATRLGVYEILAPLGAGGMGEVYRARDTKLGRDVALKVLPDDVAADAGRLARFEREARAVAALNHPNIVVLYAMEECDGVHFLTMELVDGEPLDRHVTPGGMPIPRVVELGVALADALAAAHEKGVIHRDLKPGNVVLTRDGRAKVLDFGLAKLAEPGGAGVSPSRAVTVAPASIQGEVLGTAPYMSPEQIRGDATDARTDLFALGVVLYELTAGRLPFAGTNAMEIAAAILRDTPKSLTRARSDAPPELAHVVDRCLAKDVRERVQSAREVATELRALLRALETGRAAGAGAAGAGHAAGAADAAEDLPSIAVLPFVNRSGSVEDEYFSDGLADELVGVLTKIRGLRVAARTSAFHFKGKDATIAEVGRALNVSTVVEGAVRKAGNRVRISVQLVDAESGFHLWSQTYDRTFDDIFAVQDDIAHSVVRELRPKLLGGAFTRDLGDESDVVRADVALAARGRASDPEAHRLYLHARFLFDRTNADDMKLGLEYLHRALELDPAFALAWAEISRAESFGANLGWVPAAEGYERGREAARRALALEPDLAEAHAALAWIQFTHDWDWPGAEVSCARGLALAPGNAQLLLRSAVMRLIRGEVDDAIALARRACELDPLSPFLPHSYGSMLQYGGRHAEAEVEFRRALERSPRRSATRAHLALSVLAQGRDEEALAEAANEPEEVFRVWSLAMIHAQLGRTAEADAKLLELIDKFATDSAAQVAFVHATRGDVDAAFEWLDRAFTQRDPGLAFVKVEPSLRPLHGDPRWQTFLRKMRLEAHSGAAA